jgi:hypothetical protein
VRLLQHPASRPVGRHQHGRPREPQDRAQTNPRAHGNNDGPTTQLPASDYTPGSPRPSDHDVSGRPGPIFTQDGPSSTAKTRDYTQELGLYGNLLVVPTDPDYWSPADRELVLTVDDLLVEEEGRIAPFSPTETSYAAMAASATSS